VADDDLLPGANAAQKVREEIAGVARVVLGKEAWRGVGTWRGLASPAEKPLQHAGIVTANPIRE
jgi:hypothetical protein